jgi:paraquat-inducible protein B
MSRVRIRDAWLANELMDELEVAMLEYVQTRTQDLGEEQKRSLTAQLAKAKESFKRHFGNSVVAMSKDEADLNGMLFLFQLFNNPVRVEIEPFDEELLASSKELEKEVQQTAQRIQNHRDRAPARMKETLARQNVEMEKLRTLLEKPPKQDDKENIQTEMEDIPVDQQFYQDTWRTSKNLASKLPATKRKIQDATQALQTIDANRQYLMNTSTEEPTKKIRKM